MAHASIDPVLVHSCIYVFDRADAQLEVSILGTYLRAPTGGATEALTESDSRLAGNAKCVRQAENPER